MPALDKHESPLPTTTVKWRFPSVHPEGRKYVVIAAFLTLAVYWMVSHFLGWVLVGGTIWVATFFRDPVRTTPRGDKLVVAPADGLITMIAKVPPPPELRGTEGLADGDYTRVSIFMSVFDVHINAFLVDAGQFHHDRKRVLSLKNVGCRHIVTYGSRLLILRNQLLLLLHFKRL